jgi:hypothetical protein
VAAVLAAIGVPMAHAESYLTYTGRAVSLRSRGFLYGETHVLAERGGTLAERVVLYTCGDGSAFARKTVNYVDPLAPDFLLEDTSNGMREGIRSDGRERQVFYRAGRGYADQSSRLPGVAGLVADAGFDDFVRANWKPLTSGSDLGIHFLVPSRLEDMSFKIAELRADQIDGMPVDVLRLKLAGLFGWFLPGIDVYYSVRDHVLVRYVGLSDLHDASGDNMKVDIAFDPKHRRPATKEDFDAALHARLAPCT